MEANFVIMTFSCFRETEFSCLLNIGESFLKVRKNKQMHSSNLGLMHIYIGIYVLCIHTYVCIYMCVSRYMYILNLKFISKYAVGL